MRHLPPEPQRKKKIIEKGVTEFNINGKTQEPKTPEPQSQKIMEGSRIKKVGNITIACMNSEARDLLDKLVENYETTHKKSIHDVSGYSALYWACRYSGLIQPTNRVSE